MRELSTKKIQRARAYAWTAYMLSHHPEEIHQLLKYGTPSDELIRLSNKRLFLYVDKNDIRTVYFPISLTKAAGQKLLYNTAKDLMKFRRRLPLGMFKAFQEVKTIVKCRRTDTTTNVLMVAEALYSRAATEFKVEVLFSFDSINTWIKTKYGKTLNYYTIRKALELLEEKNFITVRVWGQKNVRYKATKIYINLDASWREGSVSDSDEWILNNSAAMDSVYSRENTTRLKVLEANFQNYLEEQQAAPTPRRQWPFASTRHAPANDDKILVEPEIEGVIDIESTKETWNEYIDRLLGGVVQPVCANGFSNRQSSTGVRKPGAG